MIHTTISKERIKKIIEASTKYNTSFEIMRNLIAVFPDDKELEQIFQKPDENEATKKTVINITFGQYEELEKLIWNGEEIPRP